MTPQDDWKEQKPARREVSFVAKVGWAAVGALVTASLGYVLIYEIGRTGEDDRPPIIVRNGSVMVEEIESASRGKLTKDPDTGSTWYHEHGAGGPKKMGVEVSGVVSSNSCGTSGRYYWSDVSNVSALYTLGNGTTRMVDLMVRPAGKGKGIEADAHADAIKAQPEVYQLELDEAATATLTSVTVTWKKAGNTFTATCNLNAAPEIRLIQKK